MKVTYKAVAQVKTGWVELAATTDEILHDACNKAIFLDQFDTDKVAQQLFEEFKELVTIEYKFEFSSNFYER